MTEQIQGEKFTDTAIIVVAGGSGARTGPGLPKQYREIAGRPVIAMTLDNLARAAPGARILPVIDPAAAALYHDSIAKLAPETVSAMMEPVAGGATRQDSARRGLEAVDAIAPGPEIVLIHDAARPFVSSTLIKAAIEGARARGAAIPGLPVVDTIKQVDSTGRVTGAPDRASLRAAQTPQAFRFSLILAAHRAALAARFRDFTDDAAVAEWAGHQVHVFDGDPRNMKITNMSDFSRAEAQMIADRPDVRTGQGFDVHAFTDGDHVWLGGVKIPHDRALSGHSDADVLMHAIADAIYGALAEGDIGAWFPPSDPKWKGAASEIFLEHAASRVRARGGLIAHVDATVICETPKIGPHRDAIRARLAGVLGLAADRVAVKATTTERLGFTGRGEGVAAMATATLRLPLTT